MITVRDFAAKVCSPKSISVIIGGETYELISENTRAIDRRLLDFLGDFVVEVFKSSEPDNYALFVLERPVKLGDVSGEGASSKDCF